MPPRLLPLFLAACVAPTGDPKDAASPTDDTPAEDTAAPVDTDTDAGSDDSDTPSPYRVQPPPEPYAGCLLMPADTFFHADVRSLPVHPRSEAWRDHLGEDTRLHLPAALDRTNPLAPVRYGVPHALADADTPRRDVVYDGFYPVSRQFPGPFPLPAELDVQTGFDQQTIVLETDACELYELIGYADILFPTANGGAWFDLSEPGPGPERWSVSAPRFPLLPIQVRADELRRGRIDHALAFSIPAPSQGTPLWPALATDGRSDAPDAPPMGAWVRLKADVDLSSMPAPIRTLATALSVHGALLADTGGVEGRLMLKLQKTGDWTDAAGDDLTDVLRTLGDHITLADLEFIDAAPMRVDDASWRIR